MYSRLCGPLSWIAQYSRPILVQGNNVSILTSPQDYFEWLKCQIASANHQIRLSSLYFGTGKHESDLIDMLLSALKAKPHLQCHVILDYLRGNRGHPNSLSVFAPLLKSCPSQFNLYMYHTPRLRGFLKQMVPERINEAVGLQHTKLHLFDDNVLLTGANLSEDYFTNRQDRYIAFYSSTDLAGYLTDVHKVIARHSFVMQANGNFDNPVATPTCNPLRSRHDAQMYEASFYEAMKSLICPNTNAKSHTDTRTQSHTDDTRTQSHTDDTRTQSHTDDTRTQSHTDASTRTQSHTDASTRTQSHTDASTRTECDTVVFPLVQMGHYTIRQDELVTERILANIRSGQELYLASGYFNLPDKYKSAIMSGNGDYAILASSPQCMGFYMAKGLAGSIPQLFSNLAIQFLRQLNTQGDRVQYLEYVRPGWTYHCKGVWYYIEGENLPILTLIGSSNYGCRSLTRDLEVQVAMVTQNKKLQCALDNERKLVFEHGKQLELRDLVKSPEHKVSLWVKGVTAFLKHFV